MTSGSRIAFTPGLCTGLFPQPQKKVLLSATVQSPSVNLAAGVQLHLSDNRRWRTRHWAGGNTSFGDDQRRRGLHAARGHRVRRWAAGMNSASPPGLLQPAFTSPASSAAPNPPS